MDEKEEKSKKKGCLKIGCLSILVVVVLIIVVISITSKPSYNPLKDDSKWKEWGLIKENVLPYKEVNEITIETPTGVRRVSLWIAIKKGKYSKKQLKATAANALYELSKRKFVDEYGVFIFYESNDYSSAPSILEAYLGPNGKWSNVKERDLKTYHIGYNFP